MIDASLRELRVRLRTAGLRATPSRIAVYRLVLETRRPMSHAEVADAFAGEAWNRTTIYRNLVDLSHAELLRRADLGDRVFRFVAAGAAHGPAEHPHFVCTDCGQVLCLPGTEVRLSGPPSGPRAVRQQEVEVQVRGVCDDCS